VKNWLAVLSPVTTMGMMADAKSPSPARREKEGEGMPKKILKVLRVQNA